MNSKEIIVNGLTVRITKKKMRNMYIRIDDVTGIVKVSVPNSVTYERAREFVEKNMEWVLKTRDRVLSKDKAAPIEYVSGEELSLWGVRYNLEFIPSYEDKGVYIKDDKIIILAPLDSDSQQRKKLVDNWYRQELEEAIGELAAKCCNITGKTPMEWRIKDMKTKWGTCNTRTGRIWISLQIAARPKECLEYVMIHELTHLYVANHGPEFKAYMDRFCPDWRYIRNLLNGRIKTDN